VQKICCVLIPATAPGSQVCLQVTEVKSALEKRVLPKHRFLESIPQPINRLPADVFILIPHFFTDEEDDWHAFPMNKPLITMTHTCRSWRNLLLSTPSLWARIDFCTSNSKQAMGFLRRSGNHLLNVYQHLGNEDHVEPFLSATLCNIHRLRRLYVDSRLLYLERTLARFTSSAPELECLEVGNDPNITGGAMRLPGTIFGGKLPKLASLSLINIRMDPYDLTMPSLARFYLTTNTGTSIRDLVSFFERCPSLEFIQLHLGYSLQPPTAPPGNRVRLAALEELSLDQKASTSGLLDHLILPKCTGMLLLGQFTGGEYDQRHNPAARIHPSSIDHLPVMRGITKAVATPNSCVLSGPNGNLRFWWSYKVPENFDAEFFTPFSPISVFEIRELLVGAMIEAYPGAPRRRWKQTTAHVHGAFRVLTKVEDLTIVDCETVPFFATLGATVDGATHLPGLREFTIYVGCGDLNALALAECARARLEHSRPLGKVTIVFENEPEADLIREVESLREFVGELNYRVGATPNFGVGR
jgi:hypothetical protein